MRTAGIFRKVIAAGLVCAVAFVAFGAHAQSAKATNSQRGSEGQALQSAIRSIRAAQACSRGCHDCWYALFPGIVNDCLGLHAWKKGHFDEGLQLLRLAAGWGSKDAQYTLGMIYFNGHHVPANVALGLAWMKLADERQDNKQTERVLHSMKALATPVERLHAQQLYAQLRRRYGDQVAGGRAWQHMRRQLLATGGGNGPRRFCVLESGGVVPWSRDIAGKSDVLCLVPNGYTKAVAKIAGHYFRNLLGTVTVGPVQPVPAESSSVDH
ncbi:MAG TPA: hypothetical protein VF271_05470 [Rhodanobacteraceae bacterium]